MTSTRNYGGHDKTAYPSTDSNALGTPRYVQAPQLQYASRYSEKPQQILHTRRTLPPENTEQPRNYKPYTKRQHTFPDVLRPGRPRNEKKYGRKTSDTLARQPVASSHAVPVRTLVPHSGTAPELGLPKSQPPPRPPPPAPLQAINRSFDHQPDGQGGSTKQSTRPAEQEPSRPRQARASRNVERLERDITGLVKEECGLFVLDDRAIEQQVKMELGLLEKETGEGGKAFENGQRRGASAQKAKGKENTRIGPTYQTRRKADVSQAQARREKREEWHNEVERLPTMHSTSTHPLDPKTLQSKPRPQGLYRKHREGYNMSAHPRDMYEDNPVPRVAQTWNHPTSPDLSYPSSGNMGMKTRNHTWNHSMPYHDPDLRDTNAKSQLRNSNKNAYNNAQAQPARDRYSPPTRIGIQSTSSRTAGYPTETNTQLTGSTPVQQEPSNPNGEGKTGCCVIM